MVTYYQGSARKNRTSFQNAKVDILCSGICLNVPEYQPCADMNPHHSQGGETSPAMCCYISFSKYARRWMKMPPCWSCRSEPALITSSTETPSFRILKCLLDFTNTFLHVDNARLRILHTEVMKLGDASNWFEKPHQKSIPLSPLLIKHLSFIHMRWAFHSSNNLVHSIDIWISHLLF